MNWWIGKGKRFYDRHEQLEVLFDRACHRDLPEDPEEYWKIVGEVWKRTELPYLQTEAWITIFSETPGPNLYTKDWLKNPKIVYRGIDKTFADKDYDWSWTTDIDKAKWFSKRFNCETPAVKEFDCSKDPYRVWCVFDDDPENEVLLWSPQAVEDFY